MAIRRRSSRISCERTKLPQGILTEEMPFSMVYGTKCAISVEVIFQSTRVQSYNPKYNDIQRRVELNLVEELREHAGVRMEVYQRMTH